MDTLITVLGWIFLAVLVILALIIIYSLVSEFITNVYNYAKGNRFTLDDFIQKSNARDLRRANDLITRRLASLED